uniref:p2C18 n=1 Tax=Arundo donax TaxID=35708 RepID=A0A0A9D7S1_ARUDO
MDGGNWLILVLMAFGNRVSRLVFVLMFGLSTKNRHLKEAQHVSFSLEPIRSLLEMLVILVGYSQLTIRYCDYFRVKCLSGKCALLS